MKLLKNILVPVDFSASSINAFNYAKKVSEVFQSNLIVLHVISETSLSGDTEKLLQETIEAKYKELKEKVDPSLRSRIELVVEKGVIFEQIVQTGIKKDINVIIAGSGSEVQDERYPLSTIIEKLMRKNQVPLWVVKRSDQMPVKKILCPIDFSDASGRALNNALILADKLGAELSVLNVYAPLNIQSPRLTLDHARENEILSKRQKREFDEFLAGFRAKQVPFEELFREGIPEKEIHATIQKGGYDLLIMGTTGRTGLSRILMGSVTEKVTREVPCSFITTKSMDISRTYFESNLGEIESYLQKANYHRQKGEFEKAIALYSSGLKQFPDNIPMITGLMRTYSESGNDEKAAFFKNYARDVVSRVWGKEYIEKLGLE